jgi:hypothetical protein
MSTDSATTARAPAGPTNRMRVATRCRNRTRGRSWHNADMERTILWLTFVIDVGCAVGASAQHPATVFPGTPPMPGLWAPVAFPGSPDPGRVPPLPPNTAPAVLQPSLDWERQASARSAELRIKNGTGTNQELKGQLLAMFDEDRRARAFVEPPALSPFTVDDAAVNEIEGKNAVRLKAIVARYGWPTIALVGAEASQAATAILAHSEDHAWQEQLVPELQQLVATDKIFGSDVAAIVDSLLASSGKAQQFGTRFETRDGTIVILPVENPQQLDQRRSQYLLPPVSVFRRSLESIYHMPVKGPA